MGDPLPLLVHPSLWVWRCFFLQPSPPWDHLGGALLPIQHFSLPFGAGRMCAHWLGDLTSASLPVSILMFETSMTAYCYSVLFHEETKLTVLVLPGCPSHLGTREAWVSCVSARNPLAMWWRKTKILKNLKGTLTEKGNKSRTLSCDDFGLRASTVPRRRGGRSRRGDPQKSLQTGPCSCGALCWLDHMAE